MMIVDAHLDLAFNVSRGRDVTRPAAEQPVVDNEIATVGLPDLRAGNVGLICATIFCEPRSAKFSQGYTSAEEALVIAQTQLQWYRDRFEDGSLGLVRSRGDLDEIDHDPPASADPTRAILLLEGADPIRNADDVRFFRDAGVRIVGLAWKQTAHAGGTSQPGGLTELGRATVKHLDQLGMIHDASHLAEQAFWELLELSNGPVVASHSNCRAIVPTDRQLSDQMIRAIVQRGGMIGINYYDKFLLPPEEYGQRRATLADVVRHMQRICDLAGNANHVGIGTDLDGGLGREQVPVEITTIADLGRLAETLSSAGFADAMIANILGGNWVRYFRSQLSG
ncbi:MAG TPA: membrane dipeptidase [Tepidisphaeraceae bacterium]|nr:membrane dipeptidase [Tepidisphaeraceae bacterium]